MRITRSVLLILASIQFFGFAHIFYGLSMMAALWGQPSPTGSRSAFGYVLAGGLALAVGVLFARGRKADGLVIGLSVAGLAVAAWASISVIDMVKRPQMYWALAPVAFWLLGLSTLLQRVRRSSDPTFAA